MLIQEVLEIYQLIDRPGKPAPSVVSLLAKNGVVEKNITLKRIKEKKGSTDFIKILLPGKKGKTKKGKAPTLGIIGRLGGVGARPKIIGLVSDADGALTVLSTALKLARMQQVGDILDGDVIVATHLSTDAPTLPHAPVPFMDSPVDLATMNRHEVVKQMDAILSVDTSRGNRIINNLGFAITPTAKEGWILKVSDDLLNIMEYVTGKLPAVVPITMQDITPYGNDIYHFNSIMQPAVATSAPVVGVAITSEVPVPGSATGVSNAQQIDMAGRFVIEVAQAFTAGKINFYDKKEFSRLVSLYGEMRHLSGS